jgi:pimeloyl-ACP methyl ester carboxylesterase
VLYEGWPLLKPDALAFPPGVGERLDALLADGKREAVAETVLRELAMMSEEEVGALREQPAWPARVAAAQRITREVRAIPEATFDAEQAARISAPTLLLTGGASRDPAKATLEAVAAAIPDTRVVVLEGQGHVADILAPEVFAAHVVAFLRAEL